MLPRPLAALLAAATLACGEPLEPLEPLEPPAPGLEALTTTALAFRQVSAGYSHTCGVTVEGDAYCWGSNGEGALGTGTALDRVLPGRVRGGHRFRQISAGSFYTCAVTTGDDAFCWGLNAFGRLGTGADDFSPLSPVPVAGGLAFREVSAAGDHTCGLTTDRVAYCWGGNRFGQLGDGTITDRNRPTRVRGGHRFRQVSAGGDFTCGVTTEGAAYCWGLNATGELGRGTIAGPETCTENPCSTRPLRVLGGHGFRTVSAGVGHACGVTTDDLAYCWGLDHLGQLGAGSFGSEPCSFASCRTRPVRVVGGLTFRAVSASSFNSCGVTTGNAVYCWGQNLVGQLGAGIGIGPEPCTFEFPCSTRPIRVVGERAYRNVSVGQNSHVCGATFGSGAFCWGGNLNGELGVGTRDGPEVCEFFADPCSTKPVAVAAPRIASARRSP
jgi:alpha-tubulin suppressor-like RCC1 family protein